MSKTKKQIDEFFKIKQEQLETLQPRSQMILNDEPLYPIHECWCGNQETCDCISEPNDNDEWGEMIPLPGSRVATKEEMAELDKIKLPF